MFWNAAKKAAEVVGITEAPMIAIVDDFQDEISLETAIAEPIQVPSKSIKQVGKIAPYVVDPQQEYNKLAELFGVFTKAERVYKMSCPNCFHELSVPATSVDMQQDCVCPECGEEDTFDVFFDSVEESHSTSRNPSPEEVAMVVSKRTPTDSYDIRRMESLKAELETYYALLNGVGSLVDAGKGQTNAGLFNGIHLMYCGSACNPDSCGNGCMNPKLRWFGKIKSLQEVENALAEED